MIKDSLLQVCEDSDVNDGVTFTEWDSEAVAAGPGQQLYAYFQGDTLVGSSMTIVLKTSATESGASGGTTLVTWAFTATELNNGIAIPLPCADNMLRYNIFVKGGTWTSGALNAWIGDIGPFQTNRG